MTAPGTELLDVGTFATRVLGRPLWAHQLEVADSPARYRVMCSGRQSGKSVLLAALALHRAATRRDQTVLLVSAGEVASKRLLDECASLATRSPLLGGSVLDTAKSLLTLSNGSRILSVPASAKQIRGWPVDLLIVDEAGFIDQEIWRSAEPAIIARPGSRVILCSSPWGTADHFFRALWTRGMATPDAQVAAWHWPSTVSPLVDAALLEQIREREAPDYFEREFMAVWSDEAGAYFTEAELTRATAGYELIAPKRVPEVSVGGRPTLPVVAGIDWGMSRDANALALVGALDGEDGRWRLYVPWIEAHHSMPWSEFIDRVCDVCAAWWVRVVASERNGVGAYPTDDLRTRLRNARRITDTHVAAVWTDVRRKQSGFGMIKGLLQSDRLVLPAHPELLKQLRALEFEQLPGGATRIAVPENLGHDDLAMALMQAVSCAHPRMLSDQRSDWSAPGRTVPARSQPASDRSGDDVVFTGGGVAVPRRPRPSPELSWIGLPSGKELSEGW